MAKSLITLIISVFIAVHCYAMGGNPPEKEVENMQNNDPQVLIETTKGNIIVELNREMAPVTVDNFLGYVDSGFYDGTIFHRVIKCFMIQGGGLKPGLREKLTLYPIKNEAGNGLKNVRGTIAMARSTMVDSATSQFFINTVDNDGLDHRDNTQDGFGYCVFGRVVSGMDVVDAISDSPTHTVDFYEDVPVNDIVIISIKRK